MADDPVGEASAPLELEGYPATVPYPIGMAAIAFDGVELLDLLAVSGTRYRRARRLDFSLDTVKRYFRVSEPETLRRPPQYRAGPVAPYRDHLRARRPTEPGVAVTTLLAEITDLGCTGSLNFLHKHLNQGRAESCPHLGGSPLDHHLPR